MMPARQSLAAIFAAAFAAAMGMGMAAPALAGIRPAMVHDPLTGAPLGVASGRTVIVQFKPGAAAAARSAVHAALGAAAYRNLGAEGLYEVTLPDAVQPDDALRHYAGQAAVAGAYPNFRHYPLRMPNDALVPQQWALSQMNAFGGWEWEVGASSPATIAVMDTGIDRTHPDLAGKYDSGMSRSFCPNTGVGAECMGGSCTADPGSDAAGHGTKVAGIAAAIGDNSVGIAGVHFVSSPTLVSLKVFTDQGCSDDATIILALNYASTLTRLTGRRTVVNMSLGSCHKVGGGGTFDPATCGTCNEDAALTTAVQTALAGGTTGVVLVAAAGNQSTVGNPYGNIMCPAKITDIGGGPGVIAVGATDSNQSITSYSCRGPEMTTQGLVAPGDNVMTTLSGGGWGSSGAGTSFASPAVAGLAALILSAKPAFTPLQVLATLRNSTDKIGPSTLGLASVAPAGVSMGAGRVNAFMAMRLAIRGTLADFEGKRKAIALPNPFRPADTGSVLITIPDHLAGANPRVRIYTMDGRLVRDMTGQSWDGRNGDGIPVATGTYIFLVTTEAGRATGKVTVVR